MFAPLALTQVLPFLPLAQDDVDYQVNRRDDPGLIASLLADDSTRVMLVRSGKVAIPQGQGKLVDYDVAKIRLTMLAGSYVRDLIPESSSQRQTSKASSTGLDTTGLDTTRLDSQCIPIFLGSHAGHSYIALDISRSAMAAEVPNPRHGSVDDDFFADASSRSSSARPSILELAQSRCDWVGLREFAPHASKLEAGLATTAATLSMWHRAAHYCPHCGAATTSVFSGWAQRCQNAADDNRTIFPRIEPAVITAIVDAQDRLLLQHNSAWKSGFYSVTAGFVEAGENLEHAARREAYEETGIEISDLTYTGSQPWPFPSSLMVSFKGYARDTSIHVDGVETQSARWVSRDEFIRALTTGEMQAPGKATIARYMIEEWYGMPF
ncbi:NAD(+) diphosphatase [Bifidobacterium aquikefiricola]|uniref:NAD(+) diphosphatase n=1 Tax=Bifidobacterium aquikefiricola TaxID=3059038 RepID=A0AB39U8V7_9BIFI